MRLRGRYMTRWMHYGLLTGCTQRVGMRSGGLASMSVEKRLK